MFPNRAEPVQQALRGPGGDLRFRSSGRSADSCLSTLGGAKSLSVTSYWGSWIFSSYQIQAKKKKKCVEQEIRVMLSNLIPRSARSYRAQQVSEVSHCGYLGNNKNIFLIYCNLSPFMCVFLNGSEVGRT